MKTSILFLLSLIINAEGKFNKEDNKLIVFCHFCNVCDSISNTEYIVSLSIILISSYSVNPKNTLYSI